MLDIVNYISIALMGAMLIVVVVILRAIAASVSADDYVPVPLVNAEGQWAISFRNMDDPDRKAFFWYLKDKGLTDEQIQDNYYYTPEEVRYYIGYSDGLHTNCTPTQLHN